MTGSESMDANEYYKQLLEKQHKFLNVSQYHKLGYKGKGFTIVNAESYPGSDGHGAMTTGVINDYIPEVTVINSQLKGSGRNRFLTINGEQVELEQAIKEYKIKVITNSKATTQDDITLSYYKELQEKYGVIFFSAAGNDGEYGLRKGWHKNDTAIAVGAAQIKENGNVERMYYSSTGEELDFMCFMGRGNGTSSASPALASLAILLLQRYGDMTQTEIIEVFKSLCVDMDIEGWDKKTGWGLPVLPLTDKLEILERLRGESMDFKDVEKDRWSKNFIKICVNEGLLQGYPDGTFNPGASVTREELAVVLVRLLDKIEGRI
jgi:hypothetical protein